MKRIFSAACLCVSLFVIALNAQQPVKGPLTNESVIKLVKAGFKEKTIITIINNRPGIFNLDPEQLIELKRNRVSENIILAMLASQDATFIIGEDEWVSDEKFFKGLNKKTENDSQSSGTNIFGAGGSSQSKKRVARGRRRQRQRGKCQRFGDSSHHQTGLRGWQRGFIETRKDPRARQCRRDPPG